MLRGYSAEAQDIACLGLILSSFMEGMIRLVKQEIVLLDECKFITSANIGELNLGSED